MKLKVLISEAVSGLKNSSSPRLDADLLWGYLQGQDRLKTLLQLEEEISSHQAEAFRSLVKRRSLGEPMAYLLGKREFYGREFYTEEGVLIPRPETELLVEKTLELIGKYFPRAVVSPEKTCCKRRSLDGQRGLDAQMDLDRQPDSDVQMDLDRQPGSNPQMDREVQTGKSGRSSKAEPPFLRGLEIGPGSGIISTTLLLACPHLHMTAIDISPAAVSLTAKNAAFHGVADRLKIAEGDGCKILGEERFSFFVSNPPYISGEEMKELPVDVKDFEPHIALFGGEDGMDFYRRLAQEGQDFLNPGGFIAWEIGCGQREAVTALLFAKSYTQIQCFKDLSGKNRLVTAVKI